MKQWLLAVHMCCGLMVFKLEAQTSSEKLNQFLEPVQTGNTIPDKAWLIDIKGDTIRYSAFKGKWLVIDYWSTGCKPCIEEFPHVEQFYSSINREVMDVIRISVDSKQDRWKKSAARYRTSIPDYYAGNSSTSKINPLLALNYVVMESGGSAQLVTLTPQYVLIDPKGRITDKKLPNPSGITFREKIAAYVQGDNQTP